MKYTKAIASQIMSRFAEIGIRTKLIGSVNIKGVSKNDVDLVLLDYPTIDDKLVLRIDAQFSVVEYIITDWGGILIETLKYGRVDLFPNSFMEKCYRCRKKCC